MKTSASIQILLSCVLNLLTISAMACPGPFEGMITYKVTYSNTKFTDDLLEMFPKVLVVKVKGDLARSEIQTPLGPQIEILNYADESRISLINLNQQNFALKETAAEISETSMGHPKGTLLVTGDQKNIAGCVCTKAIFTTAGEGGKNAAEIWFTQELGGFNSNFDKPSFRDIKGVMLDFSIVTENYTMKFTAVSVERKIIAPEEFNIPADYLLTTKDELKINVVAK